jgi:hypothetical protein
MKTIQKTFRFIPKLSLVKLIGLSPEKRAMPEPVRKQKTQQVPSTWAILRNAEPTGGRAL